MKHVLNDSQIWLLCAIVKIIDGGDTINPGSVCVKTNYRKEFYGTCQKDLKVLFTMGYISKKILPHGLVHIEPTTNGLITALLHPNTLNEGD